MNGPFTVREYMGDVVDASGTVVANGYSADGKETIERDNAEMVCNALNAVYYAAQAAKGTSHG